MTVLKEELQPCNHDRSFLTEESICRALVSAKQHIQSVTFLLLPSPIQRHLRPGKPRHLAPTSYLDGLRGLAAMFVFWCHLSNKYIPGMTRYYGIGNETLASNPVQLPFVRLIMQGRLCVHLFFVISGYVLSLKSLRLARAQNWAELHVSLSSSIFRRFFRLFLPALGGTYVVIFVQIAGWWADGWGEPNGSVDGKFEPTFWNYITDAFPEMMQIIRYSWDWEAMQHIRYDGPLWTLPVEMCLSMFLFVCLAGLSRLKVALRYISMGILIWWCLYCRHSGAAEFLLGAAIAEFNLIQQERAAVYLLLPQKTSDDMEAIVTVDGQPGTETGMVTSSSFFGTSIGRREYASIAWTALCWLTFICGLYIAGWPDDVCDNECPQVPIFQYLLWIRHDKNNWSAIATAQIVFACTQLIPVQRFLNSGTVQYIGQLAFALYLMHMPLVDSIGPRVVNWLWAPFGGRNDGEGFWIHCYVWTVSIMIMSVPVFWLADLFERWVDRPCVAFARWLDKKCAVQKLE